MREDLQAAAVWNPINESMDEVSSRIHDGVPLDQLHDRAESYLDRTIFGPCPQAYPKFPGATLLEIGGGVGYIMQAMYKRLLSRSVPPHKITDLDIAPNMIDKAKERLGKESIYEFCLYDGITVPLRDESIDLIYSVAALQHIPKAYVFNLFYEVKRLLKPNGQAVFHFMSYDWLPKQEQHHPWRAEIDNQVHGKQAHWHFFYTAAELRAVLSITGFSVVEIYDDGGGTLVAFVRC